MDVRAQEKMAWYQRIQNVVILLTIGFGLSGCLGPNAVRYTRLKYNELSETQTTSNGCSTLCGSVTPTRPYSSIYPKSPASSRLPDWATTTDLISKMPEDNSQYLRGIRLLASLQEREALELAITTHEEAENSSDPTPKSAIQGRDVLNAAHDSYVYRSKGNGEVTLLNPGKELTLRVSARYVQSPEMDKMARIFHFTPGLRSYTLKSELAGTDEKLPARWATTPFTSTCDPYYG